MFSANVSEILVYGWIGSKAEFDVCLRAVDEVEGKLDIGDAPLKITADVGEDDDGSKEDEFSSEVIKVYIFKADGDEDVEIGKEHISHMCLKLIALRLQQTIIN